ncbi:MAG TPA: alpha/beta fold hydrolase [Planctomycetota bacterium]|nr:alpha/beta fold hydrolase [Planctomycetota bacterium]
MLSWLACQFAPKIRDLSEAPTPPLPEPSRCDELADRAREAAAALTAAPFTPRTDLDAYAVIFALGCRDIVTSEADQHPDTAGRTPTWAPFPEFEEVQVPGADGVVLHGRHNPGAPGAPTLILLHGLFDSHVRRYVVEYGVSLARMGFHVVALDMRDHGRLRGHGPPPSLGIHEGRDVLAAAQALSDKQGVSVGVLGFSYGGHCAVRAAHEATLAGRTDALRGGVMSLGAPLQMQEAICALDDHSRLPRPRGLRQRLVFRGLMSTLDRHRSLRTSEKGRLDHPVEDFESYIREIILPAYRDQPNLVGAFLGAARCTQPSVLGKVAVPVALIHAADDFLVPVSHLREAAREAKANPWVVTRELPAGGHSGYGVVDPEGTLGMLAAWFGTLRDG